MINENKDIASCRNPKKILTYHRQDDIIFIRMRAINNLRLFKNPSINKSQKQTTKPPNHEQKPEKDRQPRTIDKQAGNKESKN